VRFLFLAALLAASPALGQQERPVMLLVGGSVASNTNPLRQPEAVSDRITEESKKLVGDAFGEFDDMMRECAAGGAMRHQPPSFVSAIMSAIGDTTMDFIMREPAQAKRYTKAGFDAFWNAVAG